MNTQLTIFTTWSPQELKETECAAVTADMSKKYPHVKFRQFDPEALLTKHGLFNNTHIGWMKSWANTSPREHHVITRLSDIFRIALQLEYHMTYVDMDVAFLNLDSSVYGSVPNVAAPVWSEEKGALEIQNSLFCFSPAQLKYLLQSIRSLMDQRGEQQVTKNMYIYTQLGPNLFQHSLYRMQQMDPVQLYYTNSDDHWKVEDVARQHRSYGGFLFLHLDASNRRRNWYKNKKRTYPMLVQELREACPLPLQASV
ncbi:MAG: hypothetical protein SGILL_004330 [Bacillariaceae sp.]